MALTAGQDDFGHTPIRFAAKWVRGAGELAEQEPAPRDDVLFGAAACRYLDGVAPWHCAGATPLASRRPATAHTKRSASEARDEGDEAAIALEPGGLYPPPPANRVLRHRVR